MDLALITAQQVAELFILMGLGALGAKTGLLRPEGKQTLSNLLVNLVVPAMIINSYRMDFSPEILRNLLAAFALSILSSLLGLVITLLFTARSKDSRTPIFRFACIFSNAGYMGLPLISALFGSEGLLYASAYFTIFNLLLWTLGYSIVSGSSDPKKVAGSLLRCPAGSLAAVLAKQTGTEATLASQAVAHSTVCMLVTVPAMLLLTGAMFPM